MTKVIRITENELAKVIEKILLEQNEDINPKKLKFGDRGEDVKVLQKKLMTMKDSNGLPFLRTKSMVPTGYFGNMTKAALSKYEGSEQKKEEPKKNELIISPFMNPAFSNIDFSNLSTSDTTHKICKPGQTECAQFVNDFSTKIQSVGNAWLAYRNDSGLGPTIYSAFKPLDKNKIDYAVKLWQKIDDNGGPEENGRYNSEVRKFVNSLVPAKGQLPVKLQVDDIVGLFYEDSKHHEEAFYHGGKPWFMEEKEWLGLKTKYVPGKNLQQGNAWGMNTHIGIVAAIKDGVPLIFHNVGGDVRSDPPSKLRIAWVKRK